jgi:hypothetical protein
VQEDEHLGCDLCYRALRALLLQLRQRLAQMLITRQVPQQHRQLHLRAAGAAEARSIGDGQRRARREAGGPVVRRGRPQRVLQLCMEGIRVELPDLLVNDGELVGRQVEHRARARAASAPGSCRRALFRCVRLM